jgi:hypothetical protein
MHCCTYTSGLLTWSSSRGLSGIHPTKPHLGAGFTLMLSAFIRSVHSYPAVPLARHQVVTYKPMYSAYCTWESRDHRLFVSFPRLFADFHVLHHLLMPRHPPCALNRLAVEILNSRQLISESFDLLTSRQSKTPMVLLSNDIRESQLTLLIYHK